MAVDTVHIEGLQQVSQPAPDLDGAIAFYRDVLGLRFIAKFDPPGIAFLDLGGTRLFLEKDSHSAAVLYFRVPEIQAAFEALRSQGVTFDQDPQVIFRDDAGQFGAAGQEEWMAFFKDPAGNTLALASRQ